MAAIVLDNVAKRFGDVEVIRDLSLEIRSGEFLVLVGPSGCGKSTLLRMIAGLEDVSAGRILIGGRPVERLPPGARGVAMVFQNYALYPHMSVRENMTFGLRNIGVPAPEANARAKAAAERLQLLDLLERKPSQLSGGQRQRVAIGRAIVKEPKAFLFDEPLSNLDAALRAGTRVELAKLHHALGSTMVFVTHDQVEAMTMATRIVVMNGGRIEQEGSPVDVYRRPRTRFVAQFIGSPAMNLIAVSLKGAASTGTTIELPSGAVAEIATHVPSGYASERIILGIRPESIRRAADGRLLASIDVVERLGPRTLVYARLQDGSTIAYEEDGGSDAAVGAQVRLEIDLDAAHLIDGSGAVHSALGRPAP